MTLYESLLKELRKISKERSELNKRANQIKNTLLQFSKFEVGDKVWYYLGQPAALYTITHVHVNSVGRFYYTMTLPMAANPPRLQTCFAWEEHLVV